MMWFVIVLLSSEAENINRCISLTKQRLPRTRLAFFPMWLQQLNPFSSHPVQLFIKSRATPTLYHPRVVNVVCSSPALNQCLVSFDSFNLLTLSNFNWWPSYYVEMNHWQSQWGHMCLRTGPFWSFSGFKKRGRWKTEKKGARWRFTNLSKQTHAMSQPWFVIQSNVSVLILRSN